jgi:hypothetical protein
MWLICFHKHHLLAALLKWSAKYATFQPKYAMHRSGFLGGVSFSLHF